MKCPNLIKHWYKIRFQIYASGLILLASIVFFVLSFDFTIINEKPNNSEKDAISSFHSNNSIHSTGLTSQWAISSSASPEVSASRAQPPTRFGLDSMDDPISEILSRTGNDFSTTVRELLAVIPKLDPESQADAAQHVANLSDDSLAVEWSEKIVSRQLPDPACEVLFHDMLNRPQAILMPFLASLADSPKSPLHAPSVEILNVIFGTPPVGTSWKMWVKEKSQEFL